MLLENKFWIDFSRREVRRAGDASFRRCEKCGNSVREGAGEGGQRILLVWAHTIRTQWMLLCYLLLHFTLNSFCFCSFCFSSLLPSYTLQAARLRFLSSFIFSIHFVCREEFYMKLRRTFQLPLPLFHSDSRFHSHSHSHKDRLAFLTASHPTSPHLTSTTTTQAHTFYMLLYINMSYAHNLTHTHKSCSCLVFGWQKKHKIKHYVGWPKNAFHQTTDSGQRRMDKKVCHFISF